MGVVACFSLVRRRGMILGEVAYYLRSLSRKLSDYVSWKNFIFGLFSHHKGEQGGAISVARKGHFVTAELYVVVCGANSQPKFIENLGLHPN